MMGRPERVAVVGGGIMGGGLAAFFADMRIPVDLYDIDVEIPKRTLTIIADPKARIPVLMRARNARRITPRAIADAEQHLGQADLIIEAVPEVMKIKQACFETVDRFRKKGSVVTTNTSGLSVRAMAEGRSDDFRAHFLGTHFFNPVRFLPLVELIPTPDTQPGLVEMVAEIFRFVGKRPVIGKDTANFIANRVGIFAIMKCFELMKKYNFNIETVDMITGPPLGNPKTGTFRLADMVGIDTIAHVTQNQHDNCPGDESRAIFAPPDFMKRMIEGGMLGEKTKKGFYTRTPDKQILALRLDTMEYVPATKPRCDCVRVARGWSRPADRIRTMVNYDKDDPVSRFAKEIVLSSAVYALNRVGEVADDPASIDAALRWGFNRELGPIESLDALGLDHAIEGIRDLGLTVPPLLEEVARTSGRFTQTTGGRTRVYDMATKALREEPLRPGVVSLARLKEEGRIVRENLNARLIDIGDEVLFLELDAKMVPTMNPVDDFVISMMGQAVEEVPKGFRALVVGNEAAHFCAGAQLQLLLDFSERKRWTEIEAISRAFQDANLRFRHAPFPVVIAPHGMTLGGGLEITLAGTHRVVLSELYCGLVETGVGLLPGGGGCLLLLQQITRALAAKNPGPMPPVGGTFELIGYAKVSSSAQDAMEKGLIDREAVIEMSKDRLIGRAKEVAVEATKGFQRIEPTDLVLPGPGGYLAIASMIDGFVQAGTITPHSGKIAKIQARVLTGGKDASLVHPISEERFLELEREAFLELCGEPMSQARMAHMLRKGKPLLN